MPHQRLDLRRPPRVVVRMLGKHSADGLAFTSPDNPPHLRNTIHIDKRLKGRKLLEIVIHELLHLIFPGMTEEEVKRAGRYLALCLWAWGLKVDHELFTSLAESDE